MICPRCHFSLLDNCWCKKCEMMIDYNYAMGFSEGWLFDDVAEKYIVDGKELEELSGETMAMLIWRERRRRIIYFEIFMMPYFRIKNGIWGVYSGWKRLIKGRIERRKYRESLKGAVK